MIYLVKVYGIIYLGKVYSMIYLGKVYVMTYLSAIGLTTGGNNAVHSYTQTINVLSDDRSKASSKTVPTHSAI
jgi:hypothetical protein